MKSIRESGRIFGKDESGQVLVEYVLLIWFIMLATVAVAAGYKHSINGITNNVNSNLTAAANAGK